MGGGGERVGWRRCDWLKSLLFITFFTLEPRVVT